MSILPILLLALSTPALAGTPRESFIAAIGDMTKATDALTDTTYTFHQTEIVQGDQQPEYVMLVKYRRPREVYMQWTGEQNTGRQLIFRGEDWNKGKMMIDPSPWLPTISLDPNGSLAMRGQRHSIYQVGYPNIVPMFKADADRITANPQYTVNVTDHGSLLIYGEQAHCFTADLPKAQDAAFYADRVYVCVNNRTSLPALIQAWSLVDGTYVMDEEYGYEAIHVDTGLTDKDFDPATYDM